MASLDKVSVTKDMQDAADRMGLDLEDLQEMIMDVIDDCLTKAKAILEHIGAGEADKIKAIAHDIKGSSANYGLLAPSALAKELELNSQDLSREKAEELISQLETLSKLELG